MYIYANIGYDTKILESYTVVDFEITDDSCMIPVTETNEDWIQRKKWDEAAQTWVDVSLSETNTRNSLEFTHKDTNGTKHWLDVFINDLAEDVANAGSIDASDFATVDHTHTEYASQSDLDLLEDVVDTKANASHSHSEYASSTHSHTASEIGAATSEHNHDSDYADINHNHNENYADINHTHSNYATTTDLDEVSAIVNGKADTSHSHDDRYYTETEIDTKLLSKSDSSHNHTGVYDASGSAASALTSANAYTDSKIDVLVGEGASTTLDTIGEISAAIEENQNAVDALNAAIGNKANAADLTSHISNISNPHSVTLSQLGVTATSAELNKLDGVTATTTEINYLDGVTSNVQTQLDGKAASSHGTHVTWSTTTPKVNGTASVGSETKVARGDHVHPLQTSVSGNAGTATKLATARTISLTGDVTGSASFDGSANASITATIADDSHNHVIANVDGLQTALNGKAASGHNHDSAYIKKALQAIGDNGGAKHSVNVSDNVSVLTTISNLSVGLHTIYSQSGVAGNPKTSEAWRMVVHKTNAYIGWIVAFSYSGSIYSNYQTAANTFTGWRCIHEESDNVLWSGAYYMHSPNSTPQTVTPSKKLSECRTGWLLLWSDYDASSSAANDTDFCTTYIPKFNPSGGTWGGKAFYCDIPMYVGGDVTDLSTEQRCIKPIYIHDDCIKGSYQNNQGGRNDVVLRAVYEV